MKQLGVLAVVAILVVAVDSACATDYTITPIATTFDGSFFSLTGDVRSGAFSYAPLINDNGQVLFWGSTYGDVEGVSYPQYEPGNSGLWYGDGSTITEIVRSGQYVYPDNPYTTLHYKKISPGTGFNNDATATFIGTTNFDQGYLALGDATGITIVENTGHSSSATINNNDEMAYSRYDPYPTTRTLLTKNFDGSGSTNILSTTDNIGLTRLNDAGQITFTTNWAYNGPKCKMWQYDGTNINLVLDTSDIYSPFSSNVIFGLSTNNSGDILFSTDYYGCETLVEYNGTTFTELATTLGASPFVDILSAGSLNDSGDYAFAASLGATYDSPNWFIFTGPDPIEDTVIGSGDWLLGKQIDYIAIGSQALNNSGQIAFYAEFWEGNIMYNGIFRADPITDTPAVPVPSAVLLGITGLGTVMWRLRRNEEV
jgi:hypothetical protein